MIKPLDRELIDFLQLGIHTCDQGQPISCAETMLRFDITDANDNNPYFTKCPRDPIRLPEDTGVGNKLIMVVRAKDNDRINGDNPSPFGEIRYQIQGTWFYSFTEITVNCKALLITPKCNLDLVISDNKINKNNIFW